jgi:hypothetical protein
MTKLILLTCLASTLFMTGLIWFVQVVHYPLFERVDLGSFGRYHADHTRSTGLVVILPMVLELLTSFALVGQRPERVEPWMAWLGLALAVATWAATFFFSVPAHNRLARGFDAEAHRTLVRTNGLRVLAWTGHSAVLLLMTARSLR